MTTLNENEQAVYNAVKEIIEEQDVYFADIDDIIWATGMRENQVKGYLSDLQKKGVVGQIDPGQWEFYEFI